MAPPASSCPKKEEQKTDAPWSAGKGLGWEWGGWGPRGPASGWAGALLLFNHSPVTCPERETKAACPHPQYPRKGSRVALWGGASLSLSGRETRFLENLGVSRTQPGDLDQVLSPWLPSPQTSLRISTRRGFTTWMETGCWSNELKVIFFFFLKGVASRIKNAMYLMSSKYLLSTYCVSGIFLCVAETAMNKSDTHHAAALPPCRVCGGLR